MGIFEQTRSLERQQFFDGQRLFASDLQNLEAFHREMRELHNKSLHQWGIGKGFATSGERGERQVTVGPGYAIDADGHEIVLVRSRLEPVPPVAGGDDGGSAFFLLTVSYPSDYDLEETEIRQGLCKTRGTVRLREEPIFCWVRLVRDGAGKLRPADDRLDGDVREGRKIVLARVEVRDCQIEDVSIAQRRNARPATQPRIYCGRAEPVWTLVPPSNDAMPFVLQAEIDTSEAGFLTPPCYFARLEGPRLLQVLQDGEPFELFAEGLLSVSSGASADRFSVDVQLALFPVPSFDPDPEDPDPPNPGAVFQPWSVVWMGIE